MFAFATALAAVLASLAALAAVLASRAAENCDNQWRLLVRSGKRVE